MWRGKFIVFEGIDGAGLTTQSSILKNWLDEQGLAAFSTKEPTDGPIGGTIRLALSKRLTMKPAALALSFAADRMDHLETEIIPKIEKGVIVISDRYYLSSFAYQMLDLDLQWIRQLNSKALKPDLTILLDVPAGVSQWRMKRMRWHVELFEEEHKLERVRNNFHAIAEDLKKKGENIEIIDGNRQLSEVQKDVKTIALEMLRKAKGGYFLPREEKTKKKLEDFSR